MANVSGCSASLKYQIRNEKRPDSRAPSAHSHELVDDSSSKNSAFSLIIAYKSELNSQFDLIATIELNLWFDRKVAAFGIALMLLSFRLRSMYLRIGRKMNFTFGNRVDAERFE